MKRELMFKAMRADGKGWVEGFQWEERHYAFEDNNPCWFLEEKEIDPATICQATPFDINGKPIFDKDTGRIWLIDDFEEKGGFWWNCYVDQVNGCWVLKQIDLDYSNQDWPNDYTFLFESLEGLEITGNIHDDPFNCMSKEEWMTLCKPLERWDDKTENQWNSLGHV